MSNTPPTFGTDPALHGGIGWNDIGSLHRSADGGVLLEVSAIRRGSLAELVKFVTLLPAAEQADLVIDKPGDHRFTHAEIMKLAARDDFPLR
ncbi:MAG: hypothetical protein ACKOUT_00095 [Novosphingobium sp.]